MSGKTAINQACDVDYVKRMLIRMQQQNTYGHLCVQFQEGVMQSIETRTIEWPPSRRTACREKTIKKKLDDTE